jgi:hypothetical protein
LRLLITHALRLLIMRSSSAYHVLFITLSLLKTRCSTRIAPADHALLIEHRAAYHVLFIALWACLKRVVLRALRLRSRIVLRALRLLITRCSSHIALADHALFIAL